MTVADEVIVRAVLMKHESALVDAILGAWEEWRALALGGRLRFPARSRACLVYDFIAQRAMAAFDGDDSVHVVCRDETAKFLFDNQVLLRIKKASDNGLGSNISTHATLDFVGQQFVLPGFPDVHKVEVVYRLNRLQTQIEQIAVVARDGDTCLWTYLLPLTSGDAVIDLPIQVVPLQPAAPRIKVKTADKDRKNETGS